MKKRITRISIYQTAITFTTLGLIIGILIGIPMALLAYSQAHRAGEALAVLLGAPIGAALFSFVHTVIVTFFYNLAAAWTGGAEISLEDHPLD